MSREELGAKISPAGISKTCGILSAGEVIHPGAVFHCTNWLAPDRKATIQINKVTYVVTDINYANSSFWVVDANLDMNNSCPLPCWDQPPYFKGIPGSHKSRESVSFVNCSQVVRNNSLYIPAACLSTNNSFVYLFPKGGYIGRLEPSCGYLGMTLLGGQGTFSEYSGYADLVKSMRWIRCSFSSDRIYI